MTPDRLTLNGLTVRRGERVLFRDLSSDLAAGQALALTGANGAGKTTLLRVIAGLVRPEAGSVGFGETAPEAARAHGLHLMGHLDGLKGARRAGDELAFQARFLGGSPATVAAAVERLGLEPLLALEVRKLSAGQRRRLAFARLLAAPRPVWLLDEPFAPLDAVWRARIGAVMAEHLAGGGLVVAAVHDPLPVAALTLDLQPLDLGGLA
ncbi:MAG TPA: heme ABC exporter ATP-binding protein CcmA [Brevundimonas sp.]|uniref:heme ABC exporter ATP-binding protein CcmA n=1 Tax=Brevundimonas sp. TaxID=1871086 RepID=UPI00262D78D5|nr:heme ABC exporter ATP-binding protein CcmA [Brevundimonas sp.]HRO33893.1 heme ABC exporter ATP-binding protein CcmA [Brevundimonas sp.]